MESPAASTPALTLCSTFIRRIPPFIPGSDFLHSHGDHLSVGLLIAVGLEQSVEWLHRRHQKAGEPRNVSTRRCWSTERILENDDRGLRADCRDNWTTTLLLYAASRASILRRAEITGFQLWAAGLLRRGLHQCARRRHSQSDALRGSGHVRGCLFGQHAGSGKAALHSGSSCYFGQVRDALARRSTSLTGKRFRRLVATISESTRKGGTRA